MHVRRIVDLSLVLGPDTQIYPGDPPFAVRAATTIETDGLREAGVIRLGDDADGVPCRAIASELER